MIAAATSPARRPNHSRPAPKVAATAPTPKPTAITRDHRITAPGSSANHCSTPPRWITDSHAASRYVSAGGLMK